MAAAGGRKWWRWVGEELRGVGVWCCRKRISSTQQNGSGSRFTTVFGVLEAVDFALGLQDVAAAATALLRLAAPGANRGT